MPKLYFRYGTMGSSKTANLLMVAHNYTNNHKKKILVVKPSIDTRSGEYIESRAIEKPLKADIIIHEEVDDLSIDTSGYSLVLVDEAQFLSKRNVDALRKITRYIPVICYGLRTDYKTQLFPGSKRLMEIADSIEEIKTSCSECDKKAIVTGKFIWEDKNITSYPTIVRNGSDSPEIGWDEQYHSLCWFCWNDYI